MRRRREPSDVISVATVGLVVPVSVGWLVAFGKVEPVVKKVVLVALVVLLVVIGLPVLMPGMGAAHCEQCGLGVAVGSMCLAAVLAGFALAMALVARRFRTRGYDLEGLLRAVFFDRPPQLA